MVVHVLTSHPADMIGMLTYTTVPVASPTSIGEMEGLTPTCRPDAAERRHPDDRLQANRLEETDDCGMRTRYASATYTSLEKIKQNNDGIVRCVEPAARLLNSDGTGDWGSIATIDAYHFSTGLQEIDILPQNLQAIVIRRAPTIRTIVHLSCNGKTGSATVLLRTLPKPP